MTRDDLVRMLRGLQGHVARGRAPALRVPHEALDRPALGPYRCLRGLPVGQCEDRRYELDDGSGLHEHVYSDGSSVFHLDAVHAARSVLRHCVRDTRGPEGAVLGTLLGAFLRRPVLGGTLGALAGAAMPRCRLVRFELHEATELVR